VRPFTFTTEPSRAADTKSKYLAGGTSLVDLMKLDVETPDHLIYIKTSGGGENNISITSKGLRLGALATMSEVAENKDIKTKYPVIAQSLQLAASQQIRNMATIGGNTLQRTRCAYFRDVSYSDCNKRSPGSGCAALEGINRQHAILGVSDACISTYPGDFAQALIALNATVETNQRSFAFSELHTDSDKPLFENVLKAGEMIRAFTIPEGDFSRSIYLKIRDRDSYQFALASAAVALDMDGDKVRRANIGLGGVAYKPWKSKEAESFIEGKTLDEKLAMGAAEAAFGKATAREHNLFKINLGKQTLVRALLQVQSMKV
jgi:xanthine dehydrogenase YagS FAD-binding subunit